MAYVIKYTKNGQRKTLNRIFHNKADAERKKVSMWYLQEHDKSIKNVRVKKV